MSSKPYMGPAVADMVRNKTLAENIVKYHDHPTSGSILDGDNLDLLQRFVEDPSKREQILKAEGIDTEKSLEDQQVALAAYAIWAHGRKDVNGGVLKGTDIELLRKWFEGGKGKGNV